MTVAALMTQCSNTSTWKQKGITDELGCTSRNSSDQRNWRLFH